METIRCRVIKKNARSDVVWALMGLQTVYASLEHANVTMDSAEKIAPTSARTDVVVTDVVIVQATMLTHFIASANPHGLGYLALKQPTRIW